MRVLKQIFCMAGLAACLTTGQLMASPCPAGLIADYVPAYSEFYTTCDVGALIYKDFGFVDLTGGLGAPNGSLTAADFGMTPNPLTGGFDIFIPAGIYDNEKYFFSYKVDPAPVLGGEELSMDLFGSDARALSFSIASGSVLASKWACPQGDLMNLPDVSVPVDQDSVGCNSLEVDKAIFLQVMPGQSDSGMFPRPVSLTHVGILFELDGEIGNIGVKSAPLVIEINDIPEPGTSLMLAGGLMALIAARKFRR